jgi:Reverse transcriptase (RNA-dependent DNA polymerase)/Retroviral aspartyl protease
MTKTDLISSTDSVANNVQAIPQPPSSVQTLNTVNSMFEPTPISAPSPFTNSHSLHFRQRLNWEKCLPDRFVVASAISDNSLELSIVLQMTDTGEVFSTAALLDCGATGKFVHSDFVKRNCIATRLLSRPIPIYNVDGMLNEAGSITEVVEMMLRYRDHSEKTIFAVTGLGKQDVILGLTWLCEHNPEVDWKSGEVKMSRCPNHCCTCQNEANMEWKEQLVEEANIGSCRAGPMPKPDIEMEDIPDLSEVSKDEEEDEPYTGEDAMEEGDWLSTVTIHCEAEFICASLNISQRLAEAFHKNTQPKTFHESVPTYLQDFKDLFAKSSFDCLPDWKVWDHAIELVPDSKASNCKVYPLALNKHVKLDEFIQENLTTGQIQPSKSPMASPVFFIKKKHRSLRLIQDYRMLNSIMIKNRYPLPLISELVNQLCGAKFFTKLDVQWGYQNVRMKEGDKWKAVFHTNHGLYEPLVVFLGLTNSPSTFQTMMNDIFQDLIMEGVVCMYLDNILIFTKGIKEHRRITWL